MTLKFDGWPWKAKGHLFNATLGFVHHFVAIGEFKLELQSGNTQSGSNSAIFRAVWPWNLTDDLEKNGHLFYTTSSFVHHFVAICVFKRELQSGNTQSGSNSTIFRAVWPWNLSDDLEQGKSEGFDSCDRPSNLKLDSNHQFFCPCDRKIWWMTLKNNRALLLYYVKLCASFQIHWWIQTGFTVQKHSIRVEIGDMLSRVTLKFDGWPWKTIGHLFYATSSFLKHFLPLVNSNWSYSPEMTNLGQIRQFLEPCDFEIWRMTLQNNRAPLLCYFKLCASFLTHWWIQT